MTIVASVKVYDGIILGADSSTQVYGNDEQGKIKLLKTYPDAQKLFRFQELPIGVLIYGSGNIEKKSISTLLREFNNDHKYPKEANYRIETLAMELLAYFREIYMAQYKNLNKEDQPALGMVIAGFSKGSSIGEEWEFLIPRDEKPKKIRNEEIFGASWRGISIPFTRLYKGFDPRIKAELEKAGVSPELLERAFMSFISPIVFNGMPVKVAVEFVKFILKTTIGMASFEIGSPSCSEPICVAVITATEGFKFEKEL